ncbi:UNVERIFIED_CONTAM: hypothetical protein Sradi_2356800 [Sesamum radiatum]|uniref:MULE transposase domain-containing protein n=1 Tax=Sesamum radiatum TaxID=300843 RepID=A0AAW2T5L9_SESRA
MLNKFRALCFETDLFQLIDGHGKEIRIFLDAVRCPKFVAENHGKKCEPEGGDKEKNTETEDDLFDEEESVDYDEDDDCFDENVDKDAEWAGILQDDVEDELKFDSDDHTDDDSPDEFDSQKNSDDDNVAAATVFCPEDIFDPRFALGMKFSHKKEFWEAVQSRAIMTRRNLAITKNDKRRVYARCKTSGCSRHINALKIKDELGFQIREYNHVHNCGTNFNVKNVRINWLSQKYVEAFRSDPNRNVKAVKKGFLSGCRPFIGVDGCHLKGPYGGVLLTTVGVDPNNNQFPLAYAVVMSENKDNWEWFLTLLKEDLNIVRDDAYTFISDKQKGLLPAFEKVLPGVENRFCVRHLHGNMKTAGFKGLGYKKALWFAAKTTTVTQFQKAMQDLADLDVRCLEWLQDKPASQWSKSHFSMYSRCDFLLNNLCESFNSCILEAREKPILTMLEWIREYVMTRMQQLRDRAESCGKKPIKRAIFKDVDQEQDAEQAPIVDDNPVADQAPIAVKETVPQTMHFHDANPKPHIYPTSGPPPGFMKVNIRAPPPMVGHHPGFVSRPTKGK